MKDALYPYPRRSVDVLDGTESISTGRTSRSTDEIAGVE
jgi:hypothetical protein